MQFPIRTYQVEEDRLLAYLCCKDFPNGVPRTFDQLEQMLPTIKGRKFYGIVTHVSGRFEYRAAVQVKSERELELPLMRIPAGTYLATSIENWMEHTDQVHRAFRALCDDERSDEEGDSIEFYRSSVELLCLQPLKPAFQ